MQFEISGQIKSGKNHVLITRTGHRYPSPQFKAWRQEVFKQIMPQWTEQGEKVFETPVIMSVRYWPGDLRVRDVPGMEDAICHCLEKLGVVKNDGLIQEMHWYPMQIDRANPRALVQLRDA